MNRTEPCPCCGQQRPRANTPREDALDAIDQALAFWLPPSKTSQWPGWLGTSTLAREILADLERRRALAYQVLPLERAKVIVSGEYPPADGRAAGQSEVSFPFVEERDRAASKDRS